TIEEPKLRFIKAKMGGMGGDQLCSGRQTVSVEALNSRPHQLPVFVSESLDVDKPVFPEVFPPFLLGRPVKKLFPTLHEAPHALDGGQPLPPIDRRLHLWDRGSYDGYGFIMCGGGPSVA